MNHQSILILVQTVILFLIIIYLILESKEIEKKLKGAFGVLMAFAVLGLNFVVMRPKGISFKGSVITGIISCVIGIIITLIALIVEKKVLSFLNMLFLMMKTNKIILTVVLFLWVIGIILIHFNLYEWWFLSVGGMFTVWFIRVVRDNKTSRFGGQSWFGK